jgi:hypothetical protein
MLFFESSIATPLAGFPAPSNQILLDGVITPNVHYRSTISGIDPWTT